MNEADVLKFLDNNFSVKISSMETVFLSLYLLELIDS